MSENQLEELVTSIKGEKSRKDYGRTKSKKYFFVPTKIENQYLQLMFQI